MKNFSRQIPFNRFVCLKPSAGSGMIYTKAAFLLITFLFTVIISKAQNDQEFKQKLKERSEKIVKELSITDSDKYNRVVQLVADQYYALNQVHDGAKAKVADIKKRELTKENTSQLVKEEDEKKSEELEKLHASFISHLKKELSAKQVEGIKNGMTYNVLNVTYGAYQDMIPTLKKREKKQIYTWLVEAREKAMDEGSSDDKHKMFGKYKGRINNYLSEKGYDLKKEEKAWQERIRAKKQTK